LAFGAIASGTVNILKIGLQLLSLPIMARLLGPTEFGVYALALPTVSFVSLLADGGLGATLAREPESSSLVWSSAFWFMIFAGFGLAVCASVFGIFLAYIVQQPRLTAMIAVLSISLVFLVLSVPAAARLTRRRNLEAAAASELVGNLAGTAMAILLALHGAGAWSLVAQYLTVYGIRALILNVVAFELPRLEFSFESIRSHIASGGLMIGTRLSDYVGRIGENVFIDRIFGTALLGSFTFGIQISRSATETLGNVTWAALYVQALTSERANVVAVHRRFCRLLGGLLFPATFLVAASAPELIDVLLGSRWTALPLMLRVFLPMSAFSVIAAQVGPILLAIDRFRFFFWCSIGLAIARLCVICAGYWVGLEGVVFGLAAVTSVYFFTLIILAEPSTECRIIPLLRGLAGPLISSLIGACVCLLAIRSFQPGPTNVFISLSLGTIVYLVCMVLFDRSGLKEDWDIVRAMLKGHRVEP
jgi:O-antigen/teichoic acid export membrane protein